MRQYSHNPFMQTAACYYIPNGEKSQHLFLYFNFIPKSYSLNYLQAAFFIV